MSGHVGRALSRVDGYEKVTGGACYAADFAMPNLAHAVLVQSEVPHGRVRAESLRTCAARASSAAGVLHVLTPLNCPPLQVLPHELTYDLPLERRPPLSDLTVQHVGQHMAMVVADTLENATYAASLFDLEYEPLEALLTAREVLDRPIALDEKDGQFRHGSYLPDHFVKLDEEKLQDRRGHDAAPNTAFKVSARYTTPFNAHYPIELRHHRRVGRRHADLAPVRSRTRRPTGLRWRDRSPRRLPPRRSGRRMTEMLSRSPCRHRRAR